MTEDTIDSLRDVLIRHGFVRCSIPACACGSWHPRYGLTERFEEIKQALDESGHPLTNDNGNKALNALRELIKERDELREALKVLVNWTPSADTYRRLGFDPETPMRAHEAAKAALANGGTEVSDAMTRRLSRWAGFPEVDFEDRTKENSND